MTLQSDQMGNFTNNAKRNLSNDSKETYNAERPHGEPYQQTLSAIYHYDSEETDDAIRPHGRSCQ